MELNLRVGRHIAGYLRLAHPRATLRSSYQFLAALVLYTQCDAAQCQAAEKQKTSLQISVHLGLKKDR